MSMEEPDNLEGPVPGPVGQALWGRADETLGSTRPGLGFVAVSPLLSNDVVWVQANLGPMASFSGSNTSVPETERDGYAPFGRAIISGRATIFRKRATGVDALGREGDYRTLLLVGHDARRPSLLDLLTLDEAAWSPLSGDYDYESNPLPDLDLNSLPRSLLAEDLTTSRSGELPEVVRNLVRGKSVNAGQLTGADLVSIYLTLPANVRPLIALAPKWQGRPTLTLSLAADSLDAFGAVPEDEGIQGGSALPADLQDLAALLAGASSVAECLHRVDPPLEEKSVALIDLVNVWLDRPADLSADHVDRLVQSPEETLRVLQAASRRLPETHRPDRITLEVLQSCNSVEVWPSIRDVLPQSDWARATLGAAVPTPAVMVAICASNGGFEDVSVPAVQSQGLEWASAVLKQAAKEAEVLSGLVRTISQSYAYQQSWFEALARSASSDPALWFGTVIPRALRDREAVLAAISLAPDVFADWLNIEPPYYDVVIRLLAPDANPGLIAGLVKFLRTGHLRG